jgi:hypothetical protein
LPMAKLILALTDMTNIMRGYAMSIGDIERRDSVNS